MSPSNSPASEKNCSALSRYVKPLISFNFKRNVFPKPR